MSSQNADIKDEHADYRALVAHGFSAQKAAEIVLDAKRGWPWAKQWIRIATDRREEA